MEKQVKELYEFKKNQAYQFKKEQAYKLVVVKDRNGIDKVHTRSLYEERINCVAINLRYDEVPVYGGEEYFRMRMNFVEDSAGNPIKRSLHTSVIHDVIKTEKGIEIHTHNSIYVFEEAVLSEPTFLEEKELIELYLSLDEDDYFARGIYYDADKKPHELREWVHVGMFQDSVLLYPVDNKMDTVARYFPLVGTVEFYDTIYHQQVYETQMLIHNTGSTDLIIRFEGYPYQWTIAPGKEKRIMPYESEGADPKEKLKK